MRGAAAEGRGEDHTNISSTLQHCIFSDINILLNMSLQIIITPYYPNTFASVQVLCHNFFPDTQFFVYPIHQTFNNKIFESYSNLYSELFRLENTEFHFNCLFILTIICWKYVLDNICNKAVKYRRGKDILQGQEQWQEWCSCLVKLILLFISATWIRYCSVVDEGWIMERFALRQLLIIQHFDFRQTRGGQWAHAAGQPTLNTE